MMFESQHKLQRLTGDRINGRWNLQDKTANDSLESIMHLSMYRPIYHPTGKVGLILP